MTLRSHLLLVLAAALLLAFTVLGLAQYTAMRQAMVGEVDRILLVRAQALVRELEFLGSDRLDAAQIQELHLAPQSLDQAESPEVFVQILDAGGAVVAASDNVASLTLPVPEHVTGPTFYDVDLAKGPPVRLMAAPVLSGDRPVWTVVVGQSMRLARTSLQHAVWSMVAIGVSGLAATILLMGFLLGRGLAPLQRVARTAADIVRTGDVSRRVPTRQGANEVEKVAEAFNAVVGRVEHQLEAQRRLLADTSHELSNPLTVLRTDLNLLRQELDPETHAETVAEADKEAERMGRLVDELLQLSAADVAPPLVKDAAVALDELAAATVERMRPQAGERHLRLEIVGHPSVRGDADRLGQVLNNLLDNAIRYSAPESTIQVSVRAEGPVALLAVSDTGVGIAAAHLPHLFERFYRVDRARSRASGGTGLGLAIALMIVQAHGGTIQVASTPGEGSTFTVELPLQES